MTTEINPENLINSTFDKFSNPNPIEPTHLEVVESNTQPPQYLDAGVDIEALQTLNLQLELVTDLSHELWSKLVNSRMHHSNVRAYLASVESVRNLVKDIQAINNHRKPKVIGLAPWELLS